MKRVLFFSFLVLSLNGFSQDSLPKRERLTSTITGIYSVRKVDGKTKTGLYQAIYKRKIALASGKYVNNKKSGVWHFYDLNGSLIENFDFSNQLLLYEKPDDTLSEQQILYAFDDTLAATDRLTKPIKPGGRYFGYVPYLKIFKLSDDFAGTDLSIFTAVLELLISPGGRLADFKVHIKSDDFERVTSFSPELIEDDDKIFIPATINGKQVLSRIFVKCRITANGELDVF